MSKPAAREIAEALRVQGITADVLLTRIRDDLRDRPAEARQHLAFVDRLVESVSAEETRHCTICGRVQVKPAAPEWRDQ